MDVTEPFVIVAVAWALIPLGPVGASIVTLGGAVYPDPPLST